MSAAEHIARSLGKAKRERQQWRSLCPAHDDRHPSLELRDTPDGRVLWHCWSGCPQAAVGLELRRRGLIGGGHDRGCTPREIHNGFTTEIPETRKNQAQPIDATGRALELSHEAGPLLGSPGALHLERRGVSYCGGALRWHPSCPFGKDRVGCMLGLVRNILTNEPQGIHRTAIAGQGRKLSHLGGNGRLSLGPTAGGAIKLTEDAEVTTVIAIAEGIETALSIRRLPGLERMPVWAVLNANGISSFPVLPGIESVWIAADNDASGTGQKAAQTLAQRLEAAGIEAITVEPTTVGADLNDTVANG